MSVEAPGLPGMAGGPVLRQISVRAVMDALLRRGTVSRAELAKITGLSKQTTSEVIRALEERGWVREVGRLPGRVGRTAVGYGVDERAACVIGVDVGATTVRLALLSLAGSPLAEVEEPARAGDAASLLGQVRACRGRLLAEARVPAARLRGAAVATPGVLDARGVLTLAPNLRGLADVALVPALGEALGCPVEVENDINCAALGESWQGGGRGAASLAFISLGTGIGLGTVMDGRLVRGAGGAAGEISYLPFGADPHGPESLERGALEVALGAAGIAARYREAGGEVLPVREIVARAESGEPAARATLDETARIAALLVLAVAAMLDPERIVLGGHIGASLVTRVRAALPGCTRRPLAVEASRLGPRATLTGAAAIALNTLHTTLFTPQDLPGPVALPVPAGPEGRAGEAGRALALEAR